MAFIKVGDTVINTDSIVAVELARTSFSGKTYVVVTVNIGGLFRKTREFWFAGKAASSLRAYFENPDNVTVLPSKPERAPVRSRIKGVGVQSPLQPPDVTKWDDEELDDLPPPEAPPPPPTIRRRPWKPQPPSPLTAAADVEQFNPPIP